MKTIDVVMMIVLISSALVLSSLPQNNIVYYIAAFSMPISAFFLVIGIEQKLPNEKPMEKRLEEEDSKLYHYLIDNDLTEEDVKNMADQTTMEIDNESPC